MLDTTNIILSYQYVSERLTKLATGNYPKIDSYYKHFYSFFPQHPFDMEYFLQQNSEWFFPRADVVQEIFLTWDKAIKRYYSRAGKKQRKKKYSLAYYLHQRGVLRLTKIINHNLKHFKLESDYGYLFNVPVDHSDGEPLLSGANPRNLLKPSRLSMKQKMFIYRILWEGRNMESLKAEFGGDYRAVQDVIRSFG